MGMTPPQFFESFVEGNWSDCHEEPDCIRRAFNAAVAASHLADHFFSYNERHNPCAVAQFRGLGDFVEHLSASTGEAFRDIRSIANAYKHLYTDIGQKAAIHSSISSCGDIESIEIDDNQSDLRAVSTEAIVVFTRKDGQRLEFLPLLDTVVDYWRKLL